MKQSVKPVTVALRVRPLTESERTRSIASIIKQPSNPKVVIIGERGFSFDHVFIKEGQETIFNLLMTPVIEKLLQGVNCSVIAYGQTGTGKTYTMGTEPQAFGDTLNSGLISRTAGRLFESCIISDDTLTISVSFVEIYNEEVFELLTDQPVRLDVKGFQIRGLMSVPVKTMDDVGNLLCKGTNNRHTRPTLLNSSSSRSHAIFTFRLCRHIGNDVLLSELHMVDLAGSERAKRTGTCGDAFQEAVCINRGLLELGNVIQSLSSGRHGNHVPYRNSLLTSVLHGSLQIHNMIAMIACVSPSELDMAETLNTLRFVEKSKKVMQAIEINKVVQRHKNKAIPNSSAIRPRYPLALHNYQYSSVAGNAGNRQCGTGISSGPFDSVCSLNTEENISSKVNDGSGFISPIVKRCCDQIESNLNEKIEQIVLMTVQKEKKTRNCVANNVSAMVYSPLLHNSRELLPLSNDRKTVFRKEIEKFQEQMREAMKLEMRNIIQEEVKLALTNTICSTVEVLQKKKCSPGRAAPLLCRRLDFEHNTSATVGQEDIKAQPRRSLRIFGREKQNISSCKRNSLVTKDILPNVDFRENGRQMLCSTPLPFPFISLGKEKTQDELITPKKGSFLSPKRYDCIPDSLDYGGTCDAPDYCRREKTNSVEAQNTRPRRSMRLSVKYLNNVEESVRIQYNRTKAALPTPNGNVSTQHRNLQAQNTPILRTNTGQINLGSCDPVSQCSHATEIITADHSPLPEQKSLQAFDSVIQTGNHHTIHTRSDSHLHRYNNHHYSHTVRGRYLKEQTDDFTALNSHVISSSQEQQQSAVGSIARTDKINYHSQKVVLKNRNKRCTRKINHHKSPFRRESIKTPKKIIMMKELVAHNVGNNIHQEHMNRIISLLNTGNTRELQKLPTIGPKTALIINNYRNLSGETFESVDDLRKIPGLNKNFHEKFALANLVI
ncbi:kinesin heavy chain-like isoform X1 [Schistocerca cancellata]|uniref:kinesin heavy chain-like isoform X1 n=1 Tax=Schistocerca cancellata TaxID=274614 RepID=UPI0021175B82|nr:kinesin heavy chain-like isoform X1 [Schistocerca cancellata]XP_049787838.1 kinesin heavy chain-like isoform X2 [Schistocerca cancellata]XP_049787845.1 kinesin heavy chain-like isoform X3 [Schistocerca cancellata]XP_049787854.1 kinesin heavy chain-like isoform X4 [Schistocerca cancellata]XP_049787861.1 kinesin heavy chain-like isoform X1 [Schistocerca cancellata]XP_049787870.1 kinesin heavy chain-like isoform X5 [Schistocerca cancellata]XP_049787880.1 kinesin heavy chain-like isoform X1 [S